MTCLAPVQPAQDCGRNAVPIGRHSSGTLDLDLDRLLAGRMLLQGGSGAIVQPVVWKLAWGVITHPGDPT